MDGTRTFHQILVALFFCQLSLAKFLLEDTINNIWGILPREQCRIKSPEFPCKYRRRSYPPPESVHRLQPGDIDIVAALGDSIIGSTAALAPNIFHIPNQYRGVSFAIGGVGTWKDRLTIPNILRVFNPYVTGGSSVPVATENDRGTNLNLAVPGATSVTVFDQAKRLVDMLKRMQSMDRWKLITIQIGHNDVCTHPCNTTYTEFDASPYMYRKRIQHTLDYLKLNLRKTFINFVPILDVTITKELKDLSPACLFAVPYVCPCVHGGFGGKPFSRKEMQRLLNGYLKEMKYLINTNRYEREDFTVVIQPAFVNIKPFYSYSKVQRKQSPDLTYFGPDCLHPSQKLHALMARALWNNMFSPENAKQTSWSPSPPFVCPTPRNPYIATRYNNGGKSINSTSLAYNSFKYNRIVNAQCY